MAAALLIGGTLFYELIVPVAIDELKDPQKLWVFARARWAFRWLVWCSAAVLIASGTISTYRNWPAYNGSETSFIGGMTRASIEAPPPRTQPPPIEGAGYWWLAHTVGGVLAIIIALGLVKGRTPPRYPLVWMRINLVILMVVIFFASTARHVRLRILEMHIADSSPVTVPTSMPSDSE